MIEEMARFLTLMIMPLGGLLIGLFMLFITRKDRQDAEEQRRRSSH